MYAMYMTRGRAVWQLVGLITRRSEVQISPPPPFYKQIKSDFFICKQSVLAFNKDIQELQNYLYHKKVYRNLLNILLHGKFEINSHHQANYDKEYSNVRVKRQLQKFLLVSKFNFNLLINSIKQFHNKDLKNNLKFSHFFIK